MLAHRSVSTSSLISCIALLAASTASCHRPLALPTPTQLSVLGAADDYDVGPERPSTTEVDPDFPGPTVSTEPPDMTIAAMTLKPGRPRGPRRLLARITSPSDYEPMGLVKGQNLVWRNTWDSTATGAVDVVTPMRPGRPDHVLTRDPRLNRYPPTDAPHRPRLIKLSVRSFAFVACLDDPMCPTGHCGKY